MSTIFTIKASEAQGRRLDPSFYSPQYRKLDEAMSNCQYDCLEIRELQVEVFQGVSRNLLERDGIRLLKVKNILPDGAIDFSDTEPISDVPGNKILKNGDIISPFIGAAIRGYKFGYFETREGERWTFDNNTGVFRNKDARVLSRYLWAFFQLEITHRQLDRIIGGGGVPYLGTEYAKRLKVILPPLPEQRKIVAELDAAYAAKRAADEKATKLLASIDDMVLNELGIAKLPKPDTSLSSRIFTVPAREALNGRLDAYYYKSSFKELGKELTRCNSVPFGNLITEIYNGIDCRDYQDEGVPYLKVANVKPGEFSFDDLKYIDRKELGVKDIALKAGRMLLTRKGTFGNAIALSEDYDYAISSEVFCLSIRNELVDVHYLETVINSSIGRMLCDKYKIGAIMGSLSQEAVKALPIPLPDANIQRRIASNAASIRAEARKLKADATATLNAAKQKIELEIIEK